MDAKNTADKKLDDLLDQMTVEEQISMLAGADFWTTVPVERVGVPKLKVSDGPAGARGGGALVGGVKATCFPVGIAVGATFNPEMAAQMGVALAQDTKTKGARVLLAPTTNIDRTGLNGRNFESYSEDPALAAALSVAYVNGLQSEGVAATIKHYVGNESEYQRMTISSDIDERTLREIYMPPFEAAVKQAGVWAIMTGYNKVNGTYCSENEWLLTDVLRNEWGFDGLAMSDWYGTHSAVASVEAGLDLEMPGPAVERGETLVNAYKNGEIAPVAIRRAARNVLKLMDRVGCFDDPTIPEEKAVDLPEHRALIRKLGTEAAVLLKNDGALPLDKSALKQVAVLGPNAKVARVMGGGSAQINAHYRLSPFDGLSAALGDNVKLVHAIGSTNDRYVQPVDTKLTAQYFTNLELSGEPTATGEFESTSFMWMDAPSPEVDLRHFSTRVTGTYVPEQDGEHVIGMTNAGYAKLYLDDELVVNGWDGWKGGSAFFGAGNDEIRATRKLEAGKSYKLTLEYRTLDAEKALLPLSGVQFGIEAVLGETAIAEAAELAAQSDVALLFVGRNGEWDTEGLDLPHMTMPANQNALIDAVVAANPNTIVVLQTGGPVEMPWLSKVKAVLQMWYPGQELGNAVADVLLGDAEPAGRLPQTFGAKMSDYPTFVDGQDLTYPGVDGHVRYSEGLYVGYRHFDKHAITPNFPFGFGLSYTSFEWSAPRLSSSEMTEQGVTVEVDVTNTGDRKGAEVVQLFVREKNPVVDRPLKELKAFAKLHLEAGEKGTAKMTLRPRDLAYFDVISKKFRAEPGNFEILIARNANDTVSTASLELKTLWVED